MAFVARLHQPVRDGAAGRDGDDSVVDRGSRSAIAPAAGTRARSGAGGCRRHAAEPRGRRRGRAHGWSATGRTPPTQDGRAFGPDPVEGPEAPALPSAQPSATAMAAPPAPAEAESDAFAQAAPKKKASSVSAGALDELAATPAHASKAVRGSAEKLAAGAALARSESTAGAQAREQRRGGCRTQRVPEKRKRSRRPVEPDPARQRRYARDR